MQQPDVIVIGGGQAGLAAGYFLKQAGISFVILERGSGLGEVWRNRYDSLVLFTPRWYSSLPGLRLEGDPNGYATKNEIADYLKNYAEQFDLPVVFNTEVRSLTKDNGRFTITTNNGIYTSQKVIVSTGPFQKPFIPGFAESLPDEIYQVHTSKYVNPAALKPGAVLVVGAGNSGAQIAVELAPNREVYLSIGHRIKFFPIQLWNKSIFWWFSKLGILSASITSPIGKFISKQGDPIFGLELQALIKTGKVKIKPRTDSVLEHSFIFQDQSQVKVQNVIWATGFYSDYSWIRIPNLLNDAGKPVHERGVSPIEGLYFLGLPWQYRRGSALLGGVGRDAMYLAEHIQSRMD